MHKNANSLQQRINLTLRFSGRYNRILLRLFISDCFRAQTVILIQKLRSKNKCHTITTTICIVTLMQEIVHQDVAHLQVHVPLQVLIASTSIMITVTTVTIIIMGLPPINGIVTATLTLITVHQDVAHHLAHVQLHLLLATTDTQTITLIVATIFLVILLRQTLLAIVRAAIMHKLIRYQLKSMVYHQVFLLAI